MEARVNIPAHEQSTKDFLPDVICGWLVLQRSGLSASSKQTALESIETWQLSNNSGQIMSFWY